MNRKKEEQTVESPVLNETLPHISNFPSFKGTEIKMEEPFINSQGVVIGDSKYSSPNSPLNNWSDDVDPSIMAGDEWIHPTNDIGWATEENTDLLETKKREPTKQFMHPQHETRD
ncbi:DUF3905 domain-containing protein [Bacillus sp. EAC]|uniref:DUF3905 domain-containing protein n=1 Tax=Bacillus sp. EAC TaxID=1978338 RepID=UPI000B4323B9|nr:DUF3905 domain-containing protein [Bacillus sp. EAC]